MPRASKDEQGFPVLLANVPGSGVVVMAKTAQTRGNKAHDSRSGKFAAGSKKTPDAVKPPTPNVDPDAAAAQRRRRDAVRDAVRKFPELSDDNVRAFLDERVDDVNIVDIDSFLLDARVQRLYDIADILDNRLKDDKDPVRLEADDGWIGTAFNTLTDSEVVDVLQRLRYRGHDPEALVTSALDQINDESRREAIQQAFGV